jgi:hypothetical protein
MPERRFGPETARRIYGYRRSLDALESRGDMPMHIRYMELNFPLGNPAGRYFAQNETDFEAFIRGRATLPALARLQRVVTRARQPRLRASFSFIRDYFYDRPRQYRTNIAHARNPYRR